MSTNVSKLKTGKGEGPPPPAEAPGNTQRPPRDKTVPAEAMVALQLKVPESVDLAFRQQAGEEFGFKKGGNSKLFLKMWEAYQGKKAR